MYVIKVRDSVTGEVRDPDFVGSKIPTGNIQSLVLTCGQRGVLGRVERVFSVA